MAQAGLSAPSGRAHPNLDVGAGLSRDGMLRTEGLARDSL